MIFPRYGKLFRDFSTLWKTVFHGVENRVAEFLPRRGGGLRRELGAGIISLAVMGLTPLAAAPPPAQLMIGQGEVWVREFFPPTGERDIERIAWDHPPPGVDLDSLQVWSVGRLWPVRDWRWRASAVTTAATDEAAAVVWRPRDTTPIRRPAREVLDITLDRPMSHRMGHSLTYCLPGLDWRAFYRIVVRGIGPESIQSVQVDVEAHIQIHNKTSASFPHAQLSLTGSDAPLHPPPKPFGLLALNPDTPLSDLWLFRPASPTRLPHHYPLNTSANLPAHHATDLIFARVARKPAHIVHRCDSDQIPSPTQSGGLPLQRLLRIPNTAANGLGFPLPPGRADLFLGRAHGAPLQAGYVDHTPHPGLLEIDMGPTETVRATRQAEVEVPLPEGAWQADHTIILVNRLGSPVQVVAIEKPDTPMQWDLVRSSIPCTATTHELQFDITLPPHSTQTITYRLRLTANHT
ncbi:MAG: hypothetical protein PHI93_02670 [Kiritimatiellae bacterium]|nr:hypothetical protein [Kiritimatiellia bacterium]